MQSPRQNQTHTNNQKLHPCVVPHRCILPGYYVMRFGKTPESLIGYGAGIKNPVYVQQQMLASKATPGVPSRYEWVQEVYEQLTLCKYNGQPHTGKNWDRTFTNPRYGDGSMAGA